MFNLAPTDPRYLDATEEVMWTEYCAYRAAIGKPVKEYENTSFDKDLADFMAKDNKGWETVP